MNDLETTNFISTTSENTEEKLFIWAMNHNLNFNLTYHNEIVRLMNNELVEINEKLEDCNNKDPDLIFHKNLLSDEFNELLGINTFLMQWSLMEEILFHLAKRSAEANKVDYRNSSITKYKNVIKNSMNNLGNYTPWNFIVNAEKIRNCLLHINGRISYRKNGHWLKNEILFHPEYFIDKKDRLRILPDYINVFTKSCRTIIEDIL